MQYLKKHLRQCSMVSDKDYGRHCFLYEFEKGSTEAAVYVVYVKFMGRMQLMTAHIVDSFWNSEKEAEVVMIMEDVVILYSLEKRLLIKP